MTKPILRINDTVTEARLYGDVSDRPDQLVHLTASVKSYHLDRDETRRLRDFLTDVLDLPVPPRTARELYNTWPQGTVFKLNDPVFKRDPVRVKLNNEKYTDAGGPFQQVPNLLDSQSPDYVTVLFTPEVSA